MHTVCSSTEELRDAIMQELRNAAGDAKGKIQEKMETEVSSFYSQGHPKLYVRTGTLESSPKTSSVVESGNAVEFKAYLDESVSYVVPNPAFTKRGYPSTHTTHEAFESAENHTDGVLGRPGFWARSEGQFQQLLDDAMSKHFN